MSRWMEYHSQLSEGIAFHSSLYTHATADTGLWCQDQDAQVVNWWILLLSSRLLRFWLSPNSWDTVQPHNAHSATDSHVPSTLLWCSTLGLLGGLLHCQLQIYALCRNRRDLRDQSIINMIADHSLTDEAFQLYKGISNWTVFILFGCTLKTPASSLN